MEKMILRDSAKGILQITLKCKKSSDLILKAGKSFSSIPDKAVYRGGKFDVANLKFMLDRLKYEYTLEDNEVCVIGKGVDIDSSESINAISRLAIALRKIGYKSNVIKFVADVIGEDVNANKIISNCQDSSGRLTFNIGKIDINQEDETVYIEIKIPTTYKKEDIVEPLVKLAKKYNLEYKEFKLSN